MDNGGGEQAVSRSIYFEVAYLSPNIQFRILPARHMPAFQPIDARPEFHAEREVDLTDIALFKPVNVSEDFEVYLNKKDEAEILDLLLKKQDPKQKEIREARRHRAWREVHNPAAETGSGFDVYGDIKRQLVIVA